ncbi:MAG: hypothetical protein JXQ99_11005 [Hyphomicrobiaceae bacterium]
MRNISARYSGSDEAWFRETLSQFYLPFAYLTLVKRPGQHYLRRGVIQEDLAFWLIASLPLASHIGWHILGVILLVVSFWCVYEQGYVDNDRMGALHETDPKLSSAFFENKVATPIITPWIWAAVLGIMGLSALNGGTLPAPSTIAAWAATLVATALSFCLFNRVEKKHRIFVYPILQVFRAAAIAAVAPISPVAVGGVLGVVTSAWIAYVVYRQRPENKWPDMKLGAIRAIATALFSVPLLVALGFTTMNLLVAGIFIAWNIFRGRNDIVDAWRSVRFIDSTMKRPGHRS